MGRKANPETTKLPIASRVSPAIKLALDDIAKEERRNVSQVIEILLEDSPRVKAKLNGKGKRRAR